MKEIKEREFRFIRACDAVNGKKIKLEKLFNYLIKENRGDFQSEKQGAFILGLIRRASQGDLSGFDSAFMSALKEKWALNDQAAVYRFYTYTSSGNSFMNIYFLDKSGVRLHLRATWAWRQMKDCALPGYTRQTYNRMHDYRREKNAGLKEGNQEWRHRLKTIFKRP